MRYLLSEEPPPPPLPADSQLTIPPDATGQFDLYALRQELLRRLVAPPAIQMLDKQPEAVAVAVLCDRHYNDEGYTHQISLIPLRTLPEPQTDSALYKSLLTDNAMPVEGLSDPVSVRYQMLEDARLKLPAGIVELLMSEEEGWHVIALLLRQKKPRTMRLRWITPEEPVW